VKGKKDKICEKTEPAIRCNDDMLCYLPFRSSINVLLFGQSPSWRGFTAV